MVVNTRNFIKLFIPPIFLKSARAIRYAIGKNYNQATLPSKLVKIGKTHISIPGDHTLDLSLQAYPRYDQALGEIARIIYEHQGAFSAIDIGANVGDTAALICKYNDVPVLCIEGCEKFIPYLRLNAQKMGSHIHIAESFVGTQSGFVSKDSVNIRNGTASIAGLPNKKPLTEDGLSNVKPLEEILLQHKNFESAALIKIDTDGYDFSIIFNSLNYLKKSTPLLFFEYDPSFKDNNENDAAATMDALWEIGYQHFLVYDNFGNFIIALHNIQSFYDLNAYLAANRKSKQIIYYFDICAIAHSQFDLFEKIRNNELHYSLNIPTEASSK